MRVIDDGIDHDEFTLKAPWWATASVNARMASTFSPADAPAAALLLSALVGEVPGGDAGISDAASCRLMLAALKVSGGDLGRLALWVEAARQDPRDLIAAAEYRRELGDPTAAARREDLAEYLAWISGADTPEIEAR